MQIPQAEAGKTCPFNGKDTSKVCHKCPLWIKLIGTHPQTGDTYDQWTCAFAAMPILTIENSQQQRQTAAAVESFRNEMVNSNNALLTLATKGPGALVAVQ